MTKYYLSRMNMLSVKKKLLFSAERFVRVGGHTLVDGASTINN
jgi:hypothetical protein